MPEQIPQQSPPTRCLFLGMRLLPFAPAKAMMLVVLASAATTAASITPAGHTLIDGNSPAMAGKLDTADRFGRALAGLGDVDGDSIPDMVAGTRSDDDGATDAGAAYVLFLERDGTARTQTKLSAEAGGFGDDFILGLDSTFLGYGVAGPGDIDGDGVPDLAITQTRHASNLGSGALHLVFLNRDGTCRKRVTTIGVPGFALASLGDLDGDGRVELAAGSPNADDGGTDRGAIVILSLNPDGSAQTRQHISSTAGGFGEGLSDGDQFGGRGIALVGDLDGNGTGDLAVGAFGSETGRGAVWILLMNPDLTVKAKEKIGPETKGLGFVLEANDNFGHAVAAAGDLDGDGVPDLITGVNRDDEAGLDAGALVVACLHPDGRLKQARKYIGAPSEGFGLALPVSGRFGRSLGVVGNLRGDGSVCLAVGGGAGETGSVYLAFLQAKAPAATFPPAAAELANTQASAAWTGGDIVWTNWDAANERVTAAVTLEEAGAIGAALGARFLDYDTSSGRAVWRVGETNRVADPATTAWQLVWIDAHGPQVTAFSALPRNGYALAWTALPDEVFAVESSVDLSVWSPVTQIAPPGPHPVVHLAADGPTEFFRVRRLER